MTPGERMGVDQQTPLDAAAPGDPQRGDAGTGANPFDVARHDGFHRADDLHKGGSGCKAMDPPASSRPRKVRTAPLAARH